MSSIQKVISKLTQKKYVPSIKRILPADDLQHAIQCERSRSDRREIPFSILVLKGKSKEYLQSDSIMLPLLERLRVTDILGWIDSRHLAVVLTDTESDAACKVAADLQEVFQDADLKIGIEVFSYPFDGNDIDSGLEEDVKEEVLEAGKQTNGKHAKSTRAPSINPQALSFAIPLPLWKRSLDVLVSAGTLLILSPFMILTAILIKLTSRGPVFFTQWREGRNGQKFKIYKFRTMRENAEAEQDKLRHLSEQNGPAFKIEKDPRLTWLGSILRKSCFDETPQFINILKGDMTLVGPRPLPVNESLACTRWQRRRLDVTPGMTCIWQVSGNRHVDFNEWMRMDQEYIQKSGLFTDLAILAKTAVFVLMRRASV